MASDLYDIFLRSSGVSTDSRRIKEGSVFFALKGANFNGNLYAAAAIEKGAVAAVVDDPSVAVSDSFILVDDVLAALQGLAREHRRALGIPVLAITGTNGKTTTKELVSRVLASKFRVSVTRGNLNNHIGVPLTLLSMSRETEFGIVEMGASARGEIALLCTIAEPDYGLITNISKAHLEGFGGEEGVRKGKGELYAWLSHGGGKAFCNTDVPSLSGLTGQYPGLDIISYNNSSADCIDSQLEGDYNIYNIAAASAIGAYFGIPDSDIRSAVASYRPDNNRSQVIRTGANTITADCYNANPSSMHEAVRYFSVTGEGGMVILGEMGELGKYSGSEHRRLLEFVDSCAFADVILVGQGFSFARDTHRWFPDAASLSRWLAENRPVNRRILLKGSRTVGLESIIPLL